MLGDQAGPLFLHTGQGCTLATVDVGNSLIHMSTYQIDSDLL